MCVLLLGWEPEPEGGGPPKPPCARPAEAAGAVVRRADAVHHVRDVVIERRGDLVGLGLRELAGGHCRCELGLLGCDERVDQAGCRLAVRRVRDLGERLPGLKGRLQLCLGKAEIGRGRGKTGTAARPAGPVSPPATVRRHRAVHEVREPVLQGRGELVGLGLREPAGGHCRCELGLLGGHERVDQSSRRFAARCIGDLGERLPGLEGRLQFGLAEAEIARGRSEVVVRSASRAHGASRAAGSRAHVRADREAAGGRRLRAVVLPGCEGATRGDERDRSHCERADFGVPGCVHAPSLAAVPKNGL